MFFLSEVYRSFLNECLLKFVRKTGQLCGKASVGSSILDEQSFLLRGAQERDEQSLNMAEWAGIGKERRGGGGERTFQSG